MEFVGTGRLPMPMRPDEVNRLLGVEEVIKEEEPTETIPFLVGQVVEITEGPFSDFSGTVQEVLPDKGKVRVSVALFGRPTSVELDYLQLKAHKGSGSHGETSYRNRQAPGAGRPGHSGSSVGHGARPPRR